MYTLILENKDKLTLEFNSLNAAYKITNITGLSPAKTTINTNTAALIDGATYNSSKVDMRTINMAFTIEEPVEANRLNIYKVLRAKEPITLYYKTNLINVFIKGYIETLTIGHFDKKQKATVSILCPSPFFKDAQEIVNEIKTTVDMFHFPFPYSEFIVFGEIQSTPKTVVVNNGGIETGLTFELYAKSQIENPKIYDYMTQKFIGLNYTMQAGDVIIINTGQGNKNITLIRNAVESNLFNSLQKDSTWLQLASGGSVFVYETSGGSIGDLEITIKHNDLYEGV